MICIWCKCVISWIIYFWNTVSTGLFHYFLIQHQKDIELEGQEGHPFHSTCHNSNVFETFLKTASIKWCVYRILGKSHIYL